MTQDANPAEEFLIVNLKSIELGVRLLPIIIGNSRINSNITNYVYTVNVLCIAS